MFRLIGKGRVEYVDFWLGKKLLNADLIEFHSTDAYLVSDWSIVDRFVDDAFNLLVL